MTPRCGRCSQCRFDAVIEPNFVPESDVEPDNLLVLIRKALNERAVAKLDRLRAPVVDLVEH